ncbi:hypothetical protein K435DRAFT_618402, partial [Dendrothele bispora CBS 962.96]
PAHKPVSAKRSADSTELNSVKHARVTPGEGLLAIGKAVKGFGEVFEASMNRLAPKLDASPLRRHTAMELVDEKESWLSTTRQEELGDLLGDNTRKADMYIHWATRETPKRKSWVARTLNLDSTE